ARVAGATEEEVYATVELPWIPPELRENQGEVEAAREGRLPALVTAADLRGDLHAHTDWSDGHHPLERLVEAAQARGYEYVIVSAAARRNGKAAEINASPDRLELADTHARRAAALGVPIAISTDTHYLRELDHVELGVGVARRAWIEPAQVLNARPLADLLAWARPDRG